MWRRGRFTCGLAVAGAFAWGAPSSAAVRVSAQRVLPMPQAVCGVAPDPSTPTIASAGRGRLAVYTLLRGGVAAAEALSTDRGRTFTARPVTGATGCTGGPPSHQFLVNPRAAMGPDGTAWLASSWGGTDAGQFAYGVEALSSRGAVAAPDGHAQDLTVLPATSGPGVRLLWTAYDQVPNPVTYAPAGTRLETAAAGADGALGPSATAFAPEPGELLDDSSLVRVRDVLVAVASQAPLSALVATLNPATADETVQFTGITARSTDGGRTWSAGGQSGAPQLATVEHDGAKFLIGLSDVARGPRGRLARVYAIEPEDGAGRIVAVLSDDAGLTWSEPRTLVTAPVVAFQPAADFLSRGRLALTWYDGRADAPGDERVDVPPRAGVVDLASGRRRGVALGAPFDLRPLLAPGYPVDGSALGVTQDVARVRGGFAAVHTEPDPDAVTRVVFSRVRVPARR